MWEKRPSPEEGLHPFEFSPAREKELLFVRHGSTTRHAALNARPFAHVFTHYVKVTFFRGTSLRPVPPGGTGKDGRWIDIHEDDLDEARMATWVKQAAAKPGWGNA